MAVLQEMHKKVECFILAAGMTVFLLRWLTFSLELYISSIEKQTPGMANTNFTIALIVQKLIPKMKAEDILDFLSESLSGIRS